VRPEGDSGNQTNEDAAPLNPRLYLVLAESYDYLTNDKGTNVNNPPSGDSGGNGGNSPQKDDFADSANALWSLYKIEAKSHDDARIQTLKEDMDGVLIYVRQQVLCHTLYRLSA
jgi:hypothetical protein